MDDHASDIKVKNGKVMDIDGQKLVVGYACPGLTKSLKLTTYEPTEDIDIPEYVEVTADVTDFSLDFTRDDHFLRSSRRYGSEGTGRGG
ncbi:MAG: hypothetical protein ACLSHW_10705 [Lachnospiraceae bacterium]